MKTRKNRHISREKIVKDVVVLLSLVEKETISAYAVEELIKESYSWTWSENKSAGLDKRLGCRLWSKKADLLRREIKPEKESDLNSKGLCYEHLVPRAYFAKQLLKMKGAQISEENVRAYFEKFCTACVVTEAEDKLIKPTKEMPHDWDGNDVWARYRKAPEILIGELDDHFEWKSHPFPKAK